MKNNLCPSCSGRGFHWVGGDVSIPRQGPICGYCGGSGKRPDTRLNLAMWAIILLGLALAITAFLIQPLLHLSLDTVAG